MDHNKILQLLGNETRMNLLYLLLKEDSYVEKLACELSLTPATICYHLKKRENAGMVRCSRSQFYIIYSINREVFDLPLKEFIQKSPKADQTEEEKYHNQVVSNFFRYGKLTRIPSQRKKREVVLREILKSFEPDRRYSEQQVNDLIHGFHEDHCTIRREMVMFGMLSRDHDVYWVTP